MTPSQIILIHAAVRALRLTDQQYRMILKNVANARSCKQLSNAQLEDVMAVLEDMGFRDTKGDETYWRDKVSRRANGELGDRQVAKIHALAIDQPYALPALCHRFSNHRTKEVEALTGPEAYALIEMLKKVHERAGETPAPQQQQTPVTEDAPHAPAKVASLYEIPALTPGFDEAGREDVPF